jgi:hypothetical protein
MSDRREFLKTAGILSLASWSKALPAEHRNGDAGGTSSSASSNVATQAEADSVVLENGEMRLVIGAHGAARSLVHKGSGQECLAEGVDVAMFNLTQYRPYLNEVQLAYPAKVTHFPADQVRREGDNLVVYFPLLGYEATIGLKITDAYIAFRLEKLAYVGFREPYVERTGTPIDETLFVQLPVRNRKNFGEWLNVMWDEGVAVNVLATDPHTRIDAAACSGYRLFQAGTVADVQLESAGAALITTEPKHLLDRIDRVEVDFNLPRGAESRRRKEYRSSYYEVLKMTPKDADQHIHFAKMGGFRLMQIYHPAFTDSLGHFPWRPEYPGKIADLQQITAKINKEGMIPGFHVLYTMTTVNDSYVTPIPDSRLSLRRSFTLAESIDATATTITIEENPRIFNIGGNKRIVSDGGAPFHDQQKVQTLRIQNELIHYDTYTSNPPYRFEGCVRGAFGTRPATHEMSSRVGLLDMYSPTMVRYSQDTSIQAEVAARLQAIYEQAGFKFMYFDGAEDVPAPFWYTVSRAQLILQNGLKPPPLFAEGACKSHFSWHMLTRANAFDIFKPEVVKAATRAYCVEEIKRVVNDFSSIDFGWLGYWAPTKESTGTQPDMLEYVTSVAAAWNCTIALFGDLPALEAHPRTADNLEVIRRWEEVRAQAWLTEDQKISLRNVEQEHTLLIDENGKFVLLPYEQIQNVAGAAMPGRAFLFGRNGNVWAVYWHTSGQGFLDLPLAAKQVTLMKELGKALVVKGDGNHTKLPLGDRRYLEFHGLTRQQVTAAFQDARILPS